ncbi:MAG TPA: S1 RNA-binding domain-containing protein [Anaerolineae bacterium]|nr:S1 RNA-binding domain-containing protein [Anaerolineae bacterium]
MQNNLDQEPNNQENSNEDVDFLAAMENLLDQHDYEVPEVGELREGIIISKSNQGLIVDLGLKRDGIVPSSDLSKLSDEQIAELTPDSNILVYVVNTDAPDGIAISISKALVNQDWVKAQELLDNGDIVEAEVVDINRGGVLVPFGNLRGFVPASHLTTISRGMNEEQRLKKMEGIRGQNLPLKVIEVDRRRRRLVLSQRDAQKEWDETRRSELIAQLEEGQSIKGRVSGLRDFGAFVDLGGADGLIHISELAWHRVNHPREIVKIGDELDVHILKIDRDNQRISLSRKKLVPNPWQLINENYKEGQLVEGKVTRVVDYGCFVEITPGIEGLLHTSQLSRNRVENPREVVSEGETHLLRILSIDSKRQRLGLSLKAVTAQEQIEWMAQQASPEDAPSAEEPITEESFDDETASDTIENNTYDDVPSAEMDDDDVPSAEMDDDDVPSAEMDDDDAPSAEASTEDTTTTTSETNDAPATEEPTETPPASDIASEEE